MRALLAWLPLLAGCSSPAVVAPPPAALVPDVVIPPPRTGGPDGCPPAERLAVVSDLRASFSQEGPTLVLHDVRAAAAHAAPSLGGSETARRIDDAEASFYGVDTSDAPVWVLADGDLPACELHPRGHFLIEGVDPWEKVSLPVTLLEGACDLGARRARLAVKRATAPAECTIERAGAVAEPLIKERLAPAALRDAYAGVACEPPCEVRSKVDGFLGPDGRRLEWNVVSHVHAQAGVDECAWAHEDFMALLSREPDGLILEHATAYGLDDVLVERGRVVAFVDRGTSTLDVWDWQPRAQPSVARTVQFGWTHEEDGEIASLAPYCGP